SIEQRNIAANPVILSGTLASGHAWHIVTTSGVDSSCIIDGVTMSGAQFSWSPGLPPQGGGGLVSVGGSPLVRFCTLANNDMRFGGSPPGGGGAWSSGGSPRFEDCLFMSNSGGRGGAICGDVTVVRCTFDSNTASGLNGDGGAIAGDCVVQSCDF